MQLTTTWTQITNTSGLGAYVQKSGSGSIQIAYSTTAPTNAGTYYVLRQQAKERLVNPAAGEFIWARAIGRSIELVVEKTDSSLGADGVDTFSALSPYLMLNDDGTKINSTLPISTTLNSFYLGAQHKMSSGAENIFFTNLESDVDWFPMWGGIKDQSIIENQDSSGTILPSGRVYGDFINADFYGPVGNTAIDYNSQIRGLGVNLSVFGIEFAPELIPIIGDYYHYKVYSVSNGVQGFVSYEQRVVVTQEHLDRYLTDGVFLFWFNHPSEIAAGSDVNIKMFTSKTKMLNGGTELLRVFNNTLVPSAPYIKAKYRVFEDKNLAFEVDISTDELQAEIDLNTSERHTHVNKIVLDNFGEDVNQNPTYNGNTVDTIIAQRDVYDGLDSTNNTVSLSAAQGKALKDVQVDQQVEIDSNTDKVGITAEQATNITDMSMKFLGEYRVDSGVSVPLILPDLSDIGSVEIRTSSAAPEEFYIRYNHDVTDDYVLYADFIHYVGSTNSASTAEGVANSTPAYQATVGRMIAATSWKRLTPEFSSDAYRYARINLSLVQESTDSSTGGTLYAYEILVLTSRNLSDKEDVIQVYGRKK